MSCPPCTHDCRQGRKCTSRLTTGNGGNVITDGLPLLARPKTFIPDYGIEHTKVTHHITPFGRVVSIFFITVFAIAAYHQF